MSSKNIYFFEPVSNDDERINLDETDRLLMKSVAIKDNRKTQEKLKSANIFNGEYDGHLGYHLTNNILLECLYQAKLTQNEFRVFLYVMRWTAGFHQRWCHRNISKIARETGIKRENVYRSLNGLRKKNLVFDYLGQNNHKLLVINWRPWSWKNVGSLVQETVKKIIDKHKTVIEKEKIRKLKYQQPIKNATQKEIQAVLDDENDDEKLLKELEGGGVSVQDTECHHTAAPSVTTPRQGVSL
jgi:phage replication O-like protein O